MSRRPRLLAGLFLAAWLAACSRPAPPHAPAVSSTAPHVCRIGRDGGPLEADRGIGGTGGPQLAERGIGGTGGPQTADRGIGGTGIVGVITGFASICLAGQEVELPEDVAVTVDSGSASPEALRVGQVAAVEATAAGSALSARRVAVRYEIVGPVESVSGNRLRVAGQAVIIGPATWGNIPSVGQFVAVSGLRRSDRAIEATRIEPRAAGRVLVRGTLQNAGGQWRVEALPVRPGPDLAGRVGDEVTMTGSLAHGVLLADSVAPDLLATDPQAYFGPGVGTFYLEGYVLTEGGRARFGPGFAAPAPGLHPEAGRAVLHLERGPGGLRATEMPRAAFVPGGVGPRRGFEPAPVPNRSMMGPGARVGPSGPGPASASRGGRPDRGPGGGSGGGAPFQDRDAFGPGGAPPGAPGRGR